jgi:hypothetical protein
MKSEMSNVKSKNATLQNVQIGFRFAIHLSPFTGSPS